MRKILILIILTILSHNLKSVYHKVNDLTIEGTAYPKIEIMNGIAYIADHSYGLQIYDISDPTEPILLNTLYLQHEVHEILFDQTFAFLLSYYDCMMYILDVHDLANPVLLSQYNTMYPCRNVSVSAEYAFISTRHELNIHPWDEYFIEIVNIEDKVNPIYVEEYEMPSHSSIKIMDDDIAYIGTDLGLYVYDISDINNFIQIDWLDTGNTRGLEIYNDLLFFVGSEGLHVVDYANPYNNLLLSTTPDISFRQCKIIDNTLFSSFAYKMFTVDISDPYNPHLISTYNSTRYSSEVAVYEGFVYLNNCNEFINIIDASDPQCTNLINNENIKSTMIEKSPNKEYMLIYGYRYDGLHFYKMEDPLNPEFMYSHISHGGSWHCRDIYMDEDICCSVFGTKFYVYDLSNEEFLTIPGILNLWDYPQYITRKDNYIYLGCYGDNNKIIKVIDISDPFNPQIAASIDVQGWMFDLSICGDLLCFVNIDGLRIFNISDPLLPVEVGFWDSDNRAEALTLYEGLAYVSDFDGGIRVIELSDPQNPQLINTLEVNDSSQLCDPSIIRDNRLFILDKKWNEIFVYDLQNPSSPDFLFSYRWNNYSNDLEVFENYIYSANGYNEYENYGVSILDFSDYFTDADNEIISLGDFNNLSNYPNPFNPSTTIKFSINKLSNIIITVFNIKGQQIKTLINNELAKGSHSIIWNGDDEYGKLVSSGIYYFKLSVNGKTEAVKKCLLLK